MVIGKRWLEHWVGMYSKRYCKFRNFYWPGGAGNDSGGAGRCCDFCILGVKLHRLEKPIRNAGY